MARSPFPNYTQMRQPIPQAAWRALRITSFSFAVAVCVTLVASPKVGLFLFWKLIIPLLPILFFLAPGLWRNICPLAAANQTPRTLGFTRALTAPKWLVEYGYVIAIVLFSLALPTRKVLFNQDGIASAVLLAAALVGGFTAGTFLKGKSGWCSSICPLLPVQRIYGQTPFLTVPNSHCQPCVGCTKNCYDFNPRVAYLADLYDNDSYFSGYRKFFVGAFPGLVLAYFVVPNPPAISVAEVYARFTVFALVSAGSLAMLNTFVKVSANKITALYGAIALNIFYWFGAPRFIQAVTGQHAPEVITWALRAALLAATAVWVARTYAKERVFLEAATEAPSVALPGGLALQQHNAEQAGKPEVTFAPDGKRAVVTPGATLLEVAEGNGIAIESGCRMGVCGADPIAVLEGMDRLSRVSDEERDTLDRLGLAESTRMACCARVMGDVSVSLEPERPPRATTSMIANFDFDREVQRVVVIGNGIAGVTAADHVRRRHPLCEIALVADEAHHLYNRMGISRLIYGRSAMQGLYLLPDTWYEDTVITTWLNTRAASVDREHSLVHLATGETLAYDRLILATGSRSTVPQIEGFGIPGTHVLRSADDALQIRAFSQRNGCEHALVAGGGLLGLEAAYALQKLGLRVSVLERSHRLLRRQLDDRASEILHDYLVGLGIEIVMEAESASVDGDGSVTGVNLKDGRHIAGDLLLVCAGITPNIDLARDAGLEVARGVIVDDQMRTSDPRVLAAGDVAEHKGQILGLWPLAVEHAQVAADSAVGGDKTFSGTVPVTMLKVVGVELTSIGRFEAESEDDETIVLEEPTEKRYRKLVISEGKIVGAILLGFSREAALVTTAAKRGTDVSERLDALRAGDWEALGEASEEPPASLAPVGLGPG